MKKLLWIIVLVILFLCILGAVFYLGYVSGQYSMVDELNQTIQDLIQIKIK
jgi:hypothetical protein